MIHATTANNSQPRLESRNKQLTIKRGIQEQKKQLKGVKENVQGKVLRQRRLAKKGPRKPRSQGKEKKKKINVHFCLCLCARALRIVCAVEPVGKKGGSECVLVHSKMYFFSLLFLLFPVSCHTLSPSPFAKRQWWSDYGPDRSIFFCQKTKGWDFDNCESDPPQAQKLERENACVMSFFHPSCPPPFKKKNQTPHSPTQKGSLSLCISISCAQDV